MKKRGIILCAFLLMFTLLSACASKQETQITELFTKNGYTIASIEVTQRGEDKFGYKKYSVYAVINETFTQDEHDVLFDDVFGSIFADKKQISDLTIIDGANHNYSSSYWSRVVEKDLENRTNTTTQTTTETKDSSSSSFNSARHTDVEAFVCAQDIVLAKLKSPSTAVFCKFTEATVTDFDNGEYMVTGWVDAQNSFGAVIRTSFIVTYTATKSGYTNGNAEFLE